MLTRVSRQALHVVSALSAALIAIAANTQEARLEWSKASDIVFDGTVTEVGQSNVAQVPHDSRLLIVRVETVHEKPRAVSLRSGDAVTVAMKEAALPAGARARFFATGWIYANNIAVRVIGHEVIPDATVRDQAEVQRLRAAADESRLRDLLRAAEVVVQGRVAAVQSVPRDHRAPESEHDPAWQRATVRVEAAFKGAAVGDDLTVRFAGSDDVHWFKAPKLKAGDRAVFVLGRDPSTKELLAIDPRSILDEKQMPVVQRLMQR